jgi:hypothetical protein
MPFYQLDDHWGFAFDPRYTVEVIAPDGQADLFAELFGPHGGGPFSLEVSVGGVIATDAAPLSGGILNTLTLEVADLADTLEVAFIVDTTGSMDDELS